MTSVESLEPKSPDDLPKWKEDDLPSVPSGDPEFSLSSLLLTLLPLLPVESGLSATATIAPPDRIPPYYSISFLYLSASASSCLALSICSCVNKGLLRGSSSKCPIKRVRIMVPPQSFNYFLMISSSGKDMRCCFALSLCICLSFRFARFISAFLKTFRFGGDSVAEFA